MRPSPAPLLLAASLQLIAAGCGSVVYAPPGGDAGPGSTSGAGSAPLGAPCAIDAFGKDALGAASVAIDDTHVYWTTVAPLLLQRGSLATGEVETLAELSTERAATESHAEAKKLLKRFPGIGDPGSDKILLFARARRSLAPDSNALRVLVRLGFGEELSDYAKTYRLTTEAIEPELDPDIDRCIAAHLLLRRHG